MRKTRTGTTTTGPENTRRGITLLEVMIAIFVLTLGVLSVAAGILMGATQAAFGNISDRSAACGQAAFREFRIRGMSRGDMWRDVNNNAVTKLPVMIDPWMLANLPAKTTFGSVIPRCRLAQSVFTNQQQFSSFTSPDDLSFFIPDDGESRPEQVYFSSATRGNQGDYSWCAMLTAADGDDGTVAPQKWANLSIVVYYKRGWDKTASDALENSVGVTVNSGFGGASITGIPALPAHNPLRPGRWVLLTGKRAGAPLPTFKWYRVGGVDASKGAELATAATLIGPDWDATTMKNATLVVPDGVVGVYEKTIKLEGPSMWSTQ